MSTTAIEDIFPTTFGQSCTGTELGSGAEFGTNETAMIQWILKVLVPVSNGGCDVLSRL